MHWNRRYYPVPAPDLKAGLFPLLPGIPHKAWHSDGLHLVSNEWVESGTSVPSSVKQDTWASRRLVPLLTLGGTPHLTSRPTVCGWAVPGLLDATEAPGLAHGQLREEEVSHGASLNLPGIRSHGFHERS